MNQIRSMSMNSSQSATFIRTVVLLVVFMAACGTAPKAEGQQTAKLSLQNSFSALGWPSVQTDTEVGCLAVGSVSYANHAGSLGAAKSVTLKYRGPKHFRFDTQTTSGTETIIVNDLGGVMVGATGKVTALNASTAAGLKAPMFPFLHSSFDLGDSGEQVEDASSAGLPAGTAERLRLKKASGKTKESRLRELASEATVYLNASQVPVRIDFVRLGTDDQYSKFYFTLLLSDYHNVSGVMLPFRIEEWSEGRLYRVFIFDRIEIGSSSGVGDSDFRAPAITGGAQ